MDAVSPDVSPDGYPYWWADVGAYPATPGAPAGHYDVAIVGAGYTGLAAARRLARAGLSVVVLEAGAVGHGASSRNGGMVSGVLKWSPTELAHRVGTDSCRAIFAEAGESVCHLERVLRDERIDCAYSRCGMYFAAWTRRHLDTMRAEQEELAGVGVETHVLPQSEGRRELASDLYHGGKLVPLAGGLQPAAFLHGMVHAAMRHGASLFERHRVTALRRHAGRWIVELPGTRIDADHVIVATNGYSRSAPAPFARRLVPARSYVIATETLSSERVRALIPGGRMIQDSKNILYYFRPSHDGTRIVFGGRASLGDIEPVEAGRRLMKGLRRVFGPAMDGVRAEYSWRGSVAFTFDRLPHIGCEDGLHYALGYCGQGVAMSTYLGDRIAGTILEPGREGSVFERVPFRGRPGYTGNPWMLPAVGLVLKARDFVERHVLR